MDLNNFKYQVIKRKASELSNAGEVIYSGKDAGKAYEALEKEGSINPPTHHVILIETQVDGNDVTGQIEFKVNIPWGSGVEQIKKRGPEIYIRNAIGIVDPEKSEIMKFIRARGDY